MSSVGVNRGAGRRRALLAGLVLLLWLFLQPFAHGITAEEATRVGGDLRKMGGALAAANERLAAFRESVAKVVLAAPQVGEELLKAERQIRAGRAEGEMFANAALGLACLAAIVAASLLFRRLTRRWRLACLRSEVRARGAFGLVALEVGQWVVFAVGAHLEIRFYFDGEDKQALVMVAILAALVRWTLFTLFLEAALRPGIAAYRLIAMPDGTARQVRFLFATGTLIGFMGISVMPVLLRAGLPIPVGQVIVLVQGVVVSVFCLLAMWRYKAAYPAPVGVQRVLPWVAGIGIPLIWMVWNVSVLTLEFAVYHSLMYSLRIAVITYVVQALLGLSATYWWVRLVQHATNAGAALVLSIALAELWLVEQFRIVAPATWQPIRDSLETTAITLFIGFVAWRYLDLWTEQRLRAANPGLAPGIDDDVAAEPASRLTTLLPMVRITVGVLILVFVAFLGMSQLGVNVTTLLAGAGVLGLALSFGSQALVRDIVAGIFFMSDDAFRVGEYIDTGRLKGTVERVTLRSVRLRHQNGQIHTIPFGQLSAITNFSRDWQTVKFNLRLSRDTDLERARKTIKRVGLELLEDPEHGGEFLLPLKLQGMVEVSDSALVVRLKFTVKPSNPSVIQREALKRLHRAFAQDGIEFAAGVITVQSASASAPPQALDAAAATTLGTR